MKDSILRIIIPVVLLLTFAFAATAQDATIVGTVTDPSGAAVPNVAITITNHETGQVTKLTSNGVGQYVAPDLHIGRYTVRAEMSGFKASEQRDLVLNVGERARVDMKMEIGSASESVNVSATALAVQTDSGEISDVISGQQVSQLATNGRSLYSLAFLTAGATANMSDFQSPTPVGGDSSVSFNGMRQNHNLWTIDGGEASDRGGGGGLDVMPSVDAIAEFRVLTSNYSAEYGLSSAATMTMVVKGGGKDLHASAWEFVRNDKLDANNYFFNRAGNKPPKLRFNTYGFNAGGPVVLPHYNKNRDKTFFFYNMEWRKLIQGGVVNQTVPLASTYGGAFPSSTTMHVPLADQLSANQLAKFTSLGLVPGQAFPNNTIPATLLDANAQTLLKAGIFPTPNNGAQFVGGANQPTNVREEIVRIDHRFSDKFGIFGHYISEQISQTYGTSLWSGSNVPTVGTIFGNPSYHGVLRATYSISPTLLNETAFNFNGNQINIAPTGLFQRPSSLSIPELFTGNNLTRIPSVSLGGSTGTNYDISSWPWNNKADDYQIRDDVSWTKGSHQFKFGGSWALYKKVQDLFGNTQGNFNFNGKYTGNDFADFLLGLSNTYTELAVQDHGNWNNQSWALYVQDNWRVNSRLTLNLGLRWDGVPHTYEASNRGSNFYPNLYDSSKAAVLLPGGTISPTSPGLGSSPNPILDGVQFYLNGMGIAGQNGIPNGLVQNHWGTFGPRIGLAYDVTGKGKTVLRGGFGVMYERIQGNDMYNGGPNPPFSSSVTFNNVALSNPNTSLLTGETLTAPITVASITGIANTDYKLPTSYQYSFGIQQQLGRDSVLSLAYVGNQNRHQTIYGDINLPDPSVLPSLTNGTVAYNTVVPYLGYHNINLVSASVNSHYNGLQMNLKSQMRNGLTLQVAYTLSRTYDMNNSFGGDLDTVSNPYNRKYDYGIAYSDATQVGLVNFIYEIPVFRNSSSRALKTLAGGWDVSGIVSMMLSRRLCSAASA
ncbi:MAG: TonB-dependent receptor, partial [Bryobacteraceae bacterium]